MVSQTAIPYTIHGKDSICCEKYSPDVFSLSKDLSLKVKCISEAKFLKLQIVKVFVVGTKKQLDIVEKAVERETNFKILGREFSTF